MYKWETQWLCFSNLLKNIQEFKRKQTYFNSCVFDKEVIGLTAELVLFGQELNIWRTLKLLCSLQYTAKSPLNQFWK